MKFCSDCGSSDVKRSIPAGDNRERYCCNSCNMVFYQNPKIIAGCILEWQGRILLCKRSIEPRLGFWTMPAGFMENGEAVPAAASRECWEEARARAERLSLHSVYSLKYVNQVYMMYRGILKDGEAAPGDESSEVVLCEEGDIPWDKIAFPVISQMLKVFLEDRAKNDFRVHEGELRRDESGNIQISTYR